MYKIIVYETLYQHIQQKNRIITKKQFIKINEIDNIKCSELTKKVIDLKGKYKDFKYIIDFKKM